MAICRHDQLCADNDTIALQKKYQQIIMDIFQLDIPIAVISATDYADALYHAPAWWDKDRDAKQIAIFVIAPANADALIGKVGLNPKYGKISSYGQVIFWSAPIKTFSRMKCSNVIAAKAYSNITIRNANTAKKLL